MPTCIVPGCTSGYSSNPEKVHFFTIPKNDHTAKQWKIAVKRTEDSIKPGRAVCEKHFLKSDILWQRELLGPDGKVLGVTQYKVPRLRNGAVPMLFAWVECVEPDEMQSDFLPQDEKHIAKIAAVHVPAPENNECRISVADTVFSQKPDPLSVESTTAIRAEQPLVATHVQKFKDIVKAELALPSGWLKQITGCSGIPLIFFFIHKTEKINGYYETFILKDVTITETLSFQVRVLGEHLNLGRFNISCPMKDVEQLQNFLVTIHRLNVCRGCSKPPEKPEIDQLKFQKLKKDSSGTGRHVKCPLLLLGKKICVYCSREKNTIDKNLRRRIHGKVQKRRNLKLI